MTNYAPNFGMRAVQVPQVRPLQAACRHCGAEPGVRCTRWRRTKRGLVRQVRHSPHRDRVYDAKQATQMARTLITGEEPYFGEPLPKLPRMPR